MFTSIAVTFSKAKCGRSVEAALWTIRDSTHNQKRDQTLRGCSLWQHELTRFPSWRVNGGDIAHGRSTVHNAHVRLEKWYHLIIFNIATSVGTRNVVLFRPLLHDSVFSTDILLDYDMIGGTVSGFLRILYIAHAAMARALTGKICERSKSKREETQTLLYRDNDVNAHFAK